MHPYRVLQTTLASAASFSFSGDVTRFVRERHRRTPGSPVGSLSSPGRYNNGFPALYTSFARHAALEEIVQYTPDELAIEPYVMLSLRFTGLRTIDLTDPNLLRKLGTTQTEVRSLRLPGDRHPCQDLGRAARDVGAEAVVVWSAPWPRAKNLVAFDVDPPRYVVINRVRAVAVL